MIGSKGVPAAEKTRAATASLSSQQSTTVLNELREGYEAAGLTFPPGLTP